MSAPDRFQHRLQKYVRMHVLSELGYASDPAACILRETPLGIHNRVFYLEGPEGPRVVLKAIRSRRRYRELVGASEHLVKHGIPVPDILYVRPDRLLWGRLGAHLVCERYISGGTLQEKANRERYTADIARFFSRMHEVTRPWWGKPGERRTGGLYDYLEKKIKDKLRALGKRDEWFCGKRADHIVRWIAGWKAAVEQISTYSLSHCDPNPANILTADDGSIYLLDTGGIRYLPRAIDYYTLQLYLCENDESKAAAFHRAYAEAAGPGQIEALSCAQLFFKLYVIVHFMSRLTLLYRGASEEEPCRNDYRRYIAMGKQMITDIAL